MSFVRSLIYHNRYILKIYKFNGDVGEIKTREKSKDTLSRESDSL